MSAVPHILCLGCAFWDTIFQVDHVPQGGAKLLPEVVVQNASGMATVAAVTVARLGGQARLWTRIGDDPTGRLFLADLARDDVETAEVRTLPDARTWFSSILVERTGERLVVAHRPPLDENPGWLPLEAVAEFDAVLCDVRWPAGAQAVMTEGRRLGVPTILDADIAPLEVLHGLMGLADHLLLSEGALAALHPGTPPEEALRRVAARSGATVAAVTLGARGALVLAQDAAVQHVPALPVRAVDTLNAGDVWHGTYAYGLARGWDLIARVRAANVAAAIKCETFGGKTGAPDLPTLLARLGPE